MLRMSITRSGIATIGRRGFQEIGRLSIEFAVRHWCDKFLPLHFQNIAYQRYRYQPRDKRTNEYKRDRKPWPFGENTAPAIGEVKPLVFTGRSRERALSSPNITAKAPNYQTYTGVAIIDAPAFNFGAGKRIDMRDEVTRLNPQEAKTLERVFSTKWNQLLIARGVSAPKITTRTAA